MPGCARKDIVREGEIATYHAWSRCVQRSYLCGYDKETGRDFGYRRAWIEDLLAYQARLFAVDVGNYNILSNHAHVILRTRPDIAELWSPEELAYRWKMAWPKFIDGRWTRDPTDKELDELLQCPEKIDQIRKNLSSLSWFMARWKEPIARVCNAEMERTGHFWEARFGCRELLDDAASLSCNIYLDLNQLLAGMATTLENSQYSAIYNRLLAARRREEEASLEEFYEQGSGPHCTLTETDVQALYEDCWISPICSGGPLLTTDSLRSAQEPAQTTKPSCSVSSEVETVEAEAEGPDEPINTSSGNTASVAETDADAPLATQQPKAPRSKVQLTRRRASDAAIVDVPWAEYERVLRGVMEMRQLSSGDSSELLTTLPVNTQLEETLSGWGMNVSAWLAQLDLIGIRCSRVLGRADRVVQRAAEVAQQWFHGISLCRELFAESNDDEFT